MGEVGWVGLEPTTNALKGHCSTIELPTPRGEKIIGVRGVATLKWGFLRELLLLGTHERGGAAFEAEEQGAVFEFAEILGVAAVEVGEEHGLELGG